jgi:hypothetical protein
MTDFTTVAGLIRYAQRPQARTRPPFFAVLLWVLLGIGFILLALQGAPDLSAACGIAICGP